MLWIVIKGASHQIISSNIHKTEDNRHQLWVERPNGKSLKIVDSRDESEAELVKNAIDFAIRNGEPTLELE